MSAVEVRITGTREECLTVVAPLSQVAPVVVKATHPTDQGTPGSPLRRIYAEIRTRLRDP